MVAEEPCGPKFLDDLEASYAQVWYFIKFGWPPDGKVLFFIWFFVGIDPAGNH